MCHKLEDARLTIDALQEMLERLNDRIRSLERDAEQNESYAMEQRERM